MAKQPTLSGSSEPPGPDPPERPHLEPIEPPIRASVRPATRHGSTGRPWDRYDAIGAAIVLFLVALWVLHFLLPAPPPINVP